MSNSHEPPKQIGKLKLRGPASPELIKSMHDALKGTSDRLTGGATPLSAEKKKRISDNILAKLPPLSSRSR